MPDTVLVVENDPMSRELARRVLNAGGYRTLLAPDAEEALRLAAADVPDLVLMDLGLPGIDGIEATVRMHARAETADVPVAVLSAQMMGDSVERAREAGCVGYLTKPIGARELLDRVAELLAEHPRRSARPRKAEPKRAPR